MKRLNSGAWGRLRAGESGPWYCCTTELSSSLLQRVEGVVLAGIIILVTLYLGFVQRYWLASRDKDARVNFGG